jgi:hypothetical protein
MTATTNTPPSRQRGSGTFFGIPLGDFGLFASFLISFSLGFAAFFGATFIAIFTLLFYNQSGRHAVNYADSYKLAGLPAGLIVLLLSLIFFGALWIRRKASGR